MVWVDFVIPVIITISAGISLVRGFVREALSLAGWIAAFWVALRFSNSLAELFLRSITIPSLRIIIAFTILFVLTLILSTLINHLASHLVDKTGLTGTDRLIGMIFGVARGGVLVAMLVLLAGLTTLPKDPWWRESVMIGYFEQLAIWLQTTVAPEIASHFSQTG
jgi:membrane protein required for colicin V production